MPKIQLVNLKLDLLQPQSNPEKIYVKLLKWLLATGRYIVIFVELVVLAAFLLRFKLDADIASTNEAIEQQVPFIKSLSEDERLIRQTQLQLSTLKDLKQTSPNYSLILKELSLQTPEGVKLTNLNLENSTGKVEIKISGISQTNVALNSFYYNLKQDPAFSNPNLTSVGLEQGAISFSVTATTNLNAQGDKRL